MNTFPLLVIMREWKELMIPSRVWGIAIFFDVLIVINLSPRIDLFPARKK
jgi:hypothetical protein